MKKVITVILSLLLILPFFGCSKKSDEISGKDVSASIADIVSDAEGNITIQLKDGRSFNFGNLKGDKGDKGEKGDTGAQGPQGPAGRPGRNGTDGKDGVNGKDGADGKNGTNGKDGAIPTAYIKNIRIDSGRLYIQYGDGSEQYLTRVLALGKYKATERLNYGGKSVIDSRRPDSNKSYADAGGSAIVSAPKIISTYDNNQVETKRYILKTVTSADGAKVTFDYESRFGLVYYKVSAMPAKDIYIDFNYEEVEPGITIKFPNDYDSLSNVQAWCNQYDFVSLRTVQDDSRVGKLEINGSDGKSYTPGSQYTRNSDISFLINYYIEKEKNYYLDIRRTDNSSDNPTEITLTASLDEYSDFDYWEVSGDKEGLSIGNGENNPLSIGIGSAIEGSITVTGYSTNTSSSISISFENGYFE